MIRYNSPEIRINLLPDGEPGIGGKYCAIILDYDSVEGIWYNPNIAVCRADTPEEAFKQALDRFRVVELE